MGLKKKKLVFAVLCSSRGEADQSYECGFLPDGIWIRDYAEEFLHRWLHVESFNESNWNDRHYKVDRESGRILFGDGKNGSIPPTGAVILAGYRAESIGIPEIRAGETIILTGLGEKFSQKYFITETTHQISSSEYETTFTIREDEEAEDEAENLPVFSRNNYFLESY